MHGPAVGIDHAIAVQERFAARAREAARVRVARAVGRVRRGPVAVETAVVRARDHAPDGEQVHRFSSRVRSLTRAQRVRSLRGADSAGATNRRRGRPWAPAPDGSLARLREQLHVPRDAVGAVVRGPRLTCGRGPRDAHEHDAVRVALAALGRLLS